MNTYIHIYNIAIVVIGCGGNEWVSYGALLICYVYCLVFGELVTFFLGSVNVLCRSCDSCWSELVCLGDGFIFLGIESMDKLGIGMIMCCCIPLVLVENDMCVVLSF